MLLVPDMISPSLGWLSMLLLLSLSPSKGWLLASECALLSSSESAAGKLSVHSISWVREFPMAALGPVLLSNSSDMEPEPDPLLPGSLSPSEEVSSGSEKLRSCSCDISAAPVLQKLPVPAQCEV